VTLTATPVASASLAEWPRKNCGGTGTCQITMDQAQTVTATITVNGAGSQAPVAGGVTPRNGDDCPIRLAEVDIAGAKSKKV